MFRKIVSNAFNYSLNEFEKQNVICPYKLCPKFYKKAENYLKTHFDGRCSLFVLAGSDSSCLVKYKDMKYWVDYNFTSKQYEIEPYESWRG